VLCIAYMMMYWKQQDHDRPAEQSQGPRHFETGATVIATPSGLVIEYYDGNNDNSDHGL
jgi:hypothetical protein